MGGRASRAWITSALFLILSQILPPAVADSGGRDIVRGPYSLAIRGGGQSESASVGADGRADYLNPYLNIHLFGTYDALESDRGIGEVDNQRYGGGLALSHTFGSRANLFAGSAVINEVGESFAHAYLGGKLKVGAHALISAAYGVGMGDEKRITQALSTKLFGESVDWGRLGLVLVGANGWKGALQYRLTDPGDLKISGAEAALSYPVTDSITIGVNGSADLTTETDVERNWRSYAFLTYTVGGKRGRPIEVALEKNDPVIYPVILRARALAAPGTTLTISPVNVTLNGCGGGPGGEQIFTASGGVPPYTWSKGGLGRFIPDFMGDNSMAFWDDSTDDYCSTGDMFQITVMDSVGARAAADLTVIPF